MSLCTSVFLYVGLQLVLYVSLKGGGGRNIIGNCAIVDVTGLCGGNVTVCTLVTVGSTIATPNLVPTTYNTARLLTFLDALNNILIPPQEEGPDY